MTWSCQTCGLTIDEAQPGQRIFHQCAGGKVAPTKPRRPGVVRKVWNYAQAFNRWHRAGRPSRTEEHIAYLLATCQRCEYFAADTCQHAQCGCAVNSNPRALRNKLAMATESCPDGRWDAEEAIDYG